MQLTALLSRSAPLSRLPPLSAKRMTTLLDRVFQVGNVITNARARHSRRSNLICVSIRTILISRCVAR